MLRFSFLALLLLGCRTTGAAGQRAPTVDRLEVSFPTSARGTLELDLMVWGGGTVRQAQWQLLLDGHPLGSGVQVIGKRLNDLKSPVTWSAPLLTPHTGRDEGWRTVTLELAGELTVQRTLEERIPFAIRKQVLIRGAPRF